jgi:hypothetical protein
VVWPRREQRANSSRLGARERKESIGSEKRLQVVEGWRDGEIWGSRSSPPTARVDLLPPVLRALQRQRLVAARSELVFPNVRGGYTRLDNLHCVFRRS